MALYWLQAAQIADAVRQNLRTRRRVVLLAIWMFTQRQFEDQHSVQRDSTASVLTRRRLCVGSEQSR
jgi:hypothetical protein